MLVEQHDIGQHSRLELAQIALHEYGCRATQCSGMYGLACADPRIWRGVFQIVDERSQLNRLKQVLVIVAVCAVPVPCLRARSSNVWRPCSVSS